MNTVIKHSARIQATQGSLACWSVNRAPMFSNIDLGTEYWSGSERS